MNSMIHSGRIGGLALAIVLLAAITAAAQTTIEAPAADSDALVTVTAEELWRVGGFGEEESDFFGYVSDVVQNEEGLTFLLDRQLSEVKAYDKDGNYLYKFGRAGEGPGEFQRPQSMLLLPDGTIGVLQGRPQRFERFSPEGEILESLSVGGEEFMAFTMGAASVAGRVVLNRRAITVGDKEITTKAQLVSLSDDGTTGTTYLEEVSSSPRSGPGISISVDSSFAGAWALGYDGRLHVSSYDDQYRIDSYDEHGELVRVIERPYERRHRTDEELARMRKQEEEAGGGRRGRGRGDVEIDEFDRDISTMLSRPNGDLWVLDSHGRARDSEDHLGTFVVFNSMGEMTHRIRIDVHYRSGKDRFYLIGDRLYVVEEAVSAMRNMFAGFGGAVVIDGAEEDEEEPDPLSVVCYRLPGVDG